MSEMSDTTPGVGKPQDWDKAISVAYLRLCKTPQVDAGKQVGVDVRTVRRWEKSEWWPEACRQASTRWLGGLVYISQRAVFRAIKKGDANLGFRVLERQFPALAPPRQGHDIAHSGEVTTNVRAMSDEELMERHTDFANRFKNLEVADPVLLNGETNGDGG